MSVADAQLAAERAITLVKDSLGVVPFGGLPRTARVVSVTIAPRTDLGAGATFNAELARDVSRASLHLAHHRAGVRRHGRRGRRRRARMPSTSRRPQPRLLPALVENALRGAQGADLVIVSSYFGASSSTARLAAPEGMADLLTGLQKAGTRVVLASFSNPYIAQDLPPVPAYLIAWGGSPLMQRAAARALLGAGADHRAASDHHPVSRAIRRRLATRGTRSECFVGRADRSLAHAAAPNVALAVRFLRGSSADGRWCRSPTHAARDTGHIVR